MINYKAFQTQAKAILQNFGAVAVTIRLLDNSTISTIGIFTNGVAKNIDNIQNPTDLTGETSRFIIVPGIDFVGAITPGQTTTPQVNGAVEYVVNSVTYSKNITSVKLLMPIPNTPIIFTLGIA